MPIYYTYLLHHKPTNKFYYGVKFSKNSNPEDFWKRYFTSSKYIKQLIREFGEDSFEYEIRKTFLDVQKARSWENKVLRRMKVVNSESWINRTDNRAIYNEVSPTLGRIVPEEQKKRQSEKMIGNKNGSFTKGRVPWNKGKKVSDEERARLKGICSGRIPWNRGMSGVYKLSEEHKKNLSNVLKDKKKSEEHKQKISQSQKGIPRNYLKRGEDGKFIKI